VKDTFLWISRGNLKAETEDELVSVQEQVYQNKYYVTKKYNKEQIANADYVENIGDNRRHYISMPIIFKIAIYTATRVCV
jgi:hypothetical protein